MNLPAPNLDNRTFKDLVDEARARIPRYAPEWTNLNDSDPGMTLVKLHAWMTETILHELNRVPELNYIKFLDLLGIVPRAAQPARTELAFTLDKLGKATDPLSVPVPNNTKVAVDDPDLPREVVFETDRTLMAINAHIGGVFAHAGDGERTHALVTRYDTDTTWLHSFHPFDPERIKPRPAGAPAVGAISPLYLGLLLRPWAEQSKDQYVDDRLPAGPLDLYADALQVYDVLPDGDVEEGPLGMRCPAPGDGTGSIRRINWQIYTGGIGLADKFANDTDDAGWTDLALSHDGTLGLVRSGHLVLEVPAGATPLSPAVLAQSFWEGVGQPKPPRTVAELVGVLDLPGVLPGIADYWETMGVDDPDDLAAFAACSESVADTVDKINALPKGQLRPDRLTFAEWTTISDIFAVDLPQAEGGLRPLYWLRARVDPTYAEGEPRPGVLRSFHLNTVPATQAATRLDDSLGRSTGRPAQVFTVPRAPVLIDPGTGEPDLALQVGEDTEPWVRCTDFLNSKPDDPHYQLDPVTGRIQLGDGLRGRIPVADAQITVARYRTGGGVIGNVPAGTISRIKGRIRHVKGATNIRAAHDGADAEPLEQVKLRAPHELRVRDRAVTAADFADLALRTPGVSLHKAYALARRAALPGGALVEKDGAVALVVLPKNDQAAPQPSEEQLRAVCRWLEPRRLVTTELHILGPRYTRIEKLAARVTIRTGHDLSTVAEAVYAALITFLHPIRGGADGTGWPFGEDIYHGDVYEVMLGVDGVHRVHGLTLEPAEATPTFRDVTPLAEGHLPVLTRDAIHVVTDYE